MKGHRGEDERLRIRNVQKYVRALAVMGSVSPDRGYYTPQAYDSALRAHLMCQGSLGYAHPPVIFSMSKAIRDRLRTTDVSDLQAETLPLPFSFFVLAYEEEFFLICKVGEGEDKHTLAVARLGADAVGVSGVASLLKETVASTEKWLTQQYGLTPLQGKILNVFRDTIALCLYLDTEKPDIRTKSKVAVRKHDGKIILPPFRAKKNIRGRKRAKLELAAKHLIVGVSLPPLKAHANTIVRGHFKQQPHGPKHSLRKTLWIQPHLRYRDDTYPVLGRDYQ